MLDGYRDEHLEALLSLLQDALNGELTVDADRACTTTFAWPITSPRMKAAELPGLAVYRTRSAFVPRATGPHDERVTLRFLYVLPPTPADRISMRWPLLTKAWSLVAETLLAGHYVSHEGDANVLAAAGFVDVDIAGATVDFTTPPVGEDVQPQWEATVLVTLRPPVDSSSLADLSLETDIHPADLPEDERPLVSEIHDE